MSKNARQTHHIALTEQRDNQGVFKCWKIACGFVERDGVRRGKTFYLGRDKAFAEKLATRIRERWQDIRFRSAGVETVWNIGDLAEIACWIDGREVPLTDDERKGMLLHDVLARYFADLEDKADKGQITWSRYRGVKGNLELLKGMMPNIPMRLVDDGAITKMSRAVRQRYTTRYGTEVSPRTINDRLATVQQFFKWVDRWDYWEPSKLFRCDPSLWILSKNEMNKFATQAEPLTLKMEQLKVIWDAVKTPLPKLGYGPKALFLLAMNCGFSHAEFSSLKANEIYRDENGVTWIKRRRGKTGIWGCWKLWPETLEAIRAAQAQENEWGLVFLNHWGDPIHPAEHRAMPTTVKWWKDLRRKNAGFPNIGFKYLRKTSATMITKLADSRTAEIFLSHTEGAVARAYHAPDWQKLSETTDKLREQLFAVFDPPKMKLAV